MANQDLSDVAGRVLWDSQPSSCIRIKYKADGTYRAGDLTSYNDSTEKATILTYANRFKCLGVSDIEEDTDIDSLIADGTSAYIYIGRAIPARLRMTTNHATAYPGSAFKASSTENGHIMAALSTDTSFQVHGELVTQYTQDATDANFVNTLLDTK